VKRNATRRALHQKKNLDGALNAARRFVNQPPRLFF
jgi:hypothetical protein